MWRTRGPRPCRGPRCCSTSRLIIRRAVKSQLHDGRVAADPPSSHVDESRGGFGLQVSIQHLRPPSIQHALSLHEPATSSSDGVDLPALEFQERPAAGEGGESSCDCPPSTSASARAADGSAGNGRWHGSHALNSRDAAALTRRITHTRSTSELQAVVQQYRAQLNPIHIAAAIVKLAKLTAAEGGRQRARHGRLPPPQDGQRQTAAAEFDGRPGTGGGSSLSGGDPEIAQASSSNGGGSNVSDSSSSSTSSSRKVSESSAGDGSQDSRSAQKPSVDSHDGPDGGGPGGPAGPLSQAPHHHPPDRIRAASTSTSPLLADLVSAFLCQLPHYSARQYANVVWALGCMGARNHPELLSAAAVQLQAHGAAKLAAAPPQELSNLALGLAKLGYREVALWGALIAAGKRRLHEFKPQELHNMAWAVAAAAQDRSMISAAVQAALPRLRSFNASGLSNLLWSCATAQCHCEELFDGAAAALMALPPGEVSSQDVANAAWACAKLQHSHPRLMAHLARLVVLAAEQQQQQGGPGGPGAGPGAGGAGPGLRTAATQELVNTLWAFAVLPPPRSLAAESMQRQQQQEPGRWDGAAADGRFGVGVAGTGFVDGGGGGSGLQRGSSPGALGLGLGSSGSEGVGPGGEPGLRTSAVAGPAAAQGPGAYGVSSSSSSSNPSSGGPCTDGGAAAGGGGLLEAAVQALVSELSRRPDLTPQGASNSLWACARLQPCPLPPAALPALLAAAARAAGRMSDQELCNALWAAGELRNAGLFVPYGALEPLFDAACAAPRLEAMAPCGLAQLVHAAVALRHVVSPHMDVLAQQVMARLGTGSLGPQELCVMAVAMAEAVRIARYCNPILLNGLANAAVARVGELCPQGISTLLWSFARAKHYHGPLTTALCRAAKPRLRQFSDMEISNLVAALAMLKCADRQLLVAAARVMVERVRMRRQRRVAAAAATTAGAAGAGGGALNLQQPKHSSQRQYEQEPGQQLLERLLSSEEAAAEEEVGEPERQQQQQRWQQQRLWRQRQAAQAVEPVVLAEVASVSQQAAVVGVELSEGTTAATWRRGPGWHGQGQEQQQGQQQQLQTAAAADSHGDIRPVSAASLALPSDDSEASSDDAGGGGGGGGGGVLPGLPTAAAEPTLTPSPSSPEARLRLRRLPLPHHPQHPAEDAAGVPLQPRRPPPRDACSDGAASPRCAAAAAAAAAAPLPQRAAAALSSADDADNGCGGASAAAAAADPSPLDHAKSVSKLLWSYARCNLYNQSLFRLLAQELQPVLRHTTPHELALALWAVAAHGHRCPELLEAAAALLLRGGRLAALRPWDASVVAWSYAKLGHKQRELFEALQRQAAAAGGRYKEPCVMRLAWACEALEVPLREELVRRVVEVRQRERRRAVQSSYDGADGEAPAAADAACVEGEW
ncbi:hypothetical protein PLESTB_000963200 [Pleodorina starrii]|uniref:Uncharacterized protein n=1 Tax=Pleodorina starrii TaxID=330485 RepID=A0A9W6BMZ5_9CHLO|nr:hypothetical protein PLESTM_001134800 [Pleodorina starrii]GLC55241.1 hypothetical protein PLESTB_000963200 [Pleodorina starrii]